MAEEAQGFKLARGFINQLAIKGIFSEYPELNFNIWDLGATPYVAQQTEPVNRINVAIGSVADLKFAVETRITIQIIGFSELCERWVKQIREKCSALNGTFTLTDALGNDIILDGNISIQTTEPAVNLESACIEFTIIGNSIVNKESAGLF